MDDLIVIVRSTDGNSMWRSHPETHGDGRVWHFMSDYGDATIDVDVSAPFDTADTTDDRIEHVVDMTAATNAIIRDAADAGAVYAAVRAAFPDVALIHFDGWIDSNVAARFGELSAIEAIVADARDAAEAHERVRSLHVRPTMRAIGEISIAKRWQ
jgi:hypothetical protein